MQYDNISVIYDDFNDDFSYEKYLDKLFDKFDIPKSGLCLDCGCGTGSLMLELLKRGYECTGSDGSENMLSVAEEKMQAAGFSDIHLVCQDLTELDFYGAYDVVFSTLDTINHITDKRQVKKFFKRLYNFIEPNGYFIFDIKTKNGFEKTIGTQIREKNGNTMILQGDFTGTYAFYDFTVFMVNENDLYEKITDFVEERFYDSAEISEYIAQSGLVYQGRITLKNRIIYIAKKKYC